MIDHTTLRCLTVRELFALSDSIHDAGRRDVLRDCRDAKASPADTVEAMRRHAANKGLVGDMIRHAFTGTGARQIIGIVSGGEDAAEELMQAMPPDEWVTLALRLIGATREGVGAGKEEGRSASAD